MSELTTMQAHTYNLLSSVKDVKNALQPFQQRYESSQEFRNTTKVVDVWMFKMEEVYKDVCKLL